MSFQSKRKIDNDSINEGSRICYYGPETVRSMKLFHIGLPSDRMPLAIIKAFGLLKKVYAMINVQFGLEANISSIIIKACDDILLEKLNDQFPLSVWQTVSGTQTNVNVNEVISNRAIEIFGGVIGSEIPVHPTDHVNKNQSSTRIFITAMHIAAISELKYQLYPVLIQFQEVLQRNSSSMFPFDGQPHAQGGVPLTFNEELSEYIHQISMNMEGLRTCETRLYPLAIDDTTVRTEIDTTKSFGEYIVRRLARLTSFPFIHVPSSKFEELNTYNIMVELSGTLNTLAICLMKIVNDILLLYSRSRRGVGELIVSENESDSSIMPDQVNPTQYEAMTMVAAQVMSNHLALTVGISTDYFQLNIFKPLIIKNILHSIQILRDVCYSFINHPSLYIGRRQQQQQQPFNSLSEEQLVRNLAEELKQYTPRH